MAAYGANCLKTPHITRIRPARALKLFATTTDRTVGARAATVRFIVHRIAPLWDRAVNRTSKSDGCILPRSDWPDLNRAIDSLE
jgi:hypothetical protein